MLQMCYTSYDVAKSPTTMKLRVGYELDYHFPQATPVIMELNIHCSREADLERPDHIVTRPSVTSMRG